MINLTNRVRNKNTKDFIPSLPDILSSLRTNYRNKEFMRYDSHDYNDTQGKRFVIFFSDIQHKFLKKNDTWCIDKTFKTVFSHFYQLITIHGDVLEKYFLLCYILLESKTEQNYVLAFNKFTELTQTLPINIIIDFEKTLLNSIKSAFSNTKFFGCNFHFGQMIWRRIQLEGLVTLYKEKKKHINF
ncbi:hypothetical protein CDIK_1938 [Cucumispora dikerogammari]|nr:hypothetical protein CDIK_1938 [Cucumispora dikerogammari]